MFLTDEVNVIKASMIFLDNFVWFVVLIIVALNNIVDISLIGGWNQRKPPICLKSLTNFNHILLYWVHLTMDGARAHNVSGDILLTMFDTILRKIWRHKRCNQRSIDNIMATRKWTKGQTRIYKTLHRKDRATRTHWKLPLIQVIRFGKHRHRAAVNK